MRLVGEIERGIKLPPSRRSNPELRARLHQMNVGDSFITTYGTGSVHMMAKRLGIKCETRSYAGGKIRVWRVA